jgi:hypothetical protein
MQDADRSLLMSSRFTPATAERPGACWISMSSSAMSSFSPIAHISADRADWDPLRKEWLLTNGKRVTGLLPEQRRSDEVPWPAWRTNITPEEVALYRSNDYVELLSTDRINQLLGRPQSYGTVNLLTVKHSRVTQWLMNLVLVLLAVPCVLTREPGKLKQDLTRLLVIVGLAMGTIFICRQIAGHPPAGPAGCILAGAAGVDAGLSFSRRCRSIYWIACTRAAVKARQPRFGRRSPNKFAFASIELDISLVRHSVMKGCPWRGQPTRPDYASFPLSGDDAHDHFHRQLIELLVRQRRLGQLHAIQRSGQQFLGGFAAVFLRQLRDRRILHVDHLQHLLNLAVGVPARGFFLQDHVRPHAPAAKCFTSS